MPRVSVILPTYNRAHLLKRSIGSVLNQTYTDYELIIVDDNSIDDTPEVINSLGDGRIIYIKNENNLGPAEARNIGMSIAKGEYLAFQDSDDEWKPEKLNILVDEMNKGDVDLGMVFSAIYRVLETGRIIRFPHRAKEIKSGDLFYELLKNNIAGTPSVMIKRKCFLDIGGFDTSFRCFEDYEYFIRIGKKYKIKYINSPLMTAYDTPGSVNNASLIIQIEMQKRLIAKYYSDYVKDGYLLAERYFRIGDLYCRSKKYAEGKEYLKKAINSKKNKPVYYFSLMLAAVSLFFKIDMYKYFRVKIEKLRNIIKSLSI